MTGYTPGPWIAIEEGGSFGVFVVDDGKEIARLHDKRGNFPQSSLEGTQYLYSGQHEANALLIAAAPDLFEALEKMRGILRDLQPALNVMAREVLDDIIAEQIEPALARARGEGA